MNILIDPTDNLMLLLDHQNGLFQTVKDVPAIISGCCPADDKPLWGPGSKCFAF
jgi:hypothetical protein